ncbi:acyl-CoA dehydrogenase family protein [Phreatobacter stygius]|uniref:Acyl-CoA dehydrogenase n=1 Tax=Phreatobacter stygius TaxID=1940610 RepID=A0A4D7BBJ8_9HYPH|nr:acyl-CoA dehydrogenase family protein [Phreatobacter stygius]QCI65417.1 acyl-CoA dehydrogenase [Phreatobacter stygius]
MSPLNLPKPAWHTEEHQMLADSAKAFLAKEFVPNIERWTEAGVMDRDAWTKAGEAGLLSASIPEEYGGSGGNYGHEAIIAHEIGLAGADSWGWAIHGPIVAPYIFHYGTSEQKQNWLTKMATGELIAALAMTEPGAGSDVQGIRTKAERSGNGWVLNGSKTFITNGQHANMIVVAAKTDPSQGAKGVSLFVVETDNAPGFRRGRKLKKLGLDWADTSELFFDDMKLPAEALLGSEPNQGFYQMMQSLPQERLTIAGAAVAMIERALGLTIDYVKERKAFGKRIIDFQNTQFELADMKTQATMAKVFYEYCVGLHIEGKCDTAMASMAKYKLSDLQNTIVDRCLQLFGGYGFMDEYPISRMYRDARIQRIYGGTNEIMKLLISRTL